MLALTSLVSVVVHVKEMCVIVVASREMSLLFVFKRQGKLEMQ